MERWLPGLPQYPEDQERSPPRPSTRARRRSLGVASAGIEPATRGVRKRPAAFCGAARPLAASSISCSLSPTATTCIETQARAAVLGRLTWTLAEVGELIDETPRVRSIVLDVPDWPGHRAGQHVDVHLTAEDGYQAQRSYSITSAPEDLRLMLTVERLTDGEVSSNLVGELRPADTFELRGAIGGYFVWETRMGGPLLLVAGGYGRLDGHRSQGRW